MIQRIKYIINLLIKLFLSPIKYARHIGVKVGNNTLIADKRHWPSDAYLISIGNNCAITKGVTIYTHGGGRLLRSSIPDFDSFGKVRIGNNCYIGAYSQIMPGVTIEDNVLVAAGSVVTKSVPSGYVVGGNPARIICSTASFIERNSKYNLHSKGMSHKEKRQFLLSLPEDKFMVKPFLKVLDDKK